MANDTHRQIEQLVARLARRVRFQRALEGTVTGLAVASMFVSVVLVLAKTGWIAPTTFTTAALVSLVIPVSLALAGWLRPLDRISLAQRLDRTHGLHDRLSTALSLSERGPDGEFERAQIADAAKYVAQVRPTDASPLTRPTDLVALVLLVLGLLALVALRTPQPTGAFPTPPEIRHDRVLSVAAVELERDMLASIRRDLEGIDDPETLAVLDEIDVLLNAIDAQEISEREFLERLDELQEKLEEAQEKADETERFAQKLKEAAEAMEKELKRELQQEPEARALVDAMKNKDLEAAADAMQKIAEKMADKEISDKQLERLAKVMEKLAKNLDLSNPALQKLMEQNKDLIDKLSKKFDSLSDEEKQRLNRAKEELGKQEAEQKAEEERESQRQLKELRRVSEVANAEAERVLKNKNDRIKGNKEATEEMEHEFREQAGRHAEQAAEQMEEGGEEQRKQQARQRAQQQLDEMRETMQRGAAAKQRAQRLGGDGAQGEDQKGEQMKDFLDRARGNMKLKVEQAAPAGGEGKDQNGNGKAGDLQSADHVASKEEAQGSSDVAGQGEGSRQLGEESEIDSRRVDTKVDVEAGEGPSRAEIIKSASEEGFATTDYKDVYVDYSSVVEEVMEKEKIPAGYRYYVKRYFQLIKPQE